MSGTVLNSLYIVCIPQQSFEVGFIIIIPILQKKSRHRAIQQFAYSHIARNMDRVCSITHCTVCPQITDQSGNWGPLCVICSLASKVSGNKEGKKTSPMLIPNVYQKKEKKERREGREKGRRNWRAIVSFEHFALCPQLKSGTCNGAVRSGCQGHCHLKNFPGGSTWHRYWEPRGKVELWLLSAPWWSVSKMWH